jgi:beta-lactamase regulating signal transducer with metallopeptidase domain/Tol biopolymer transport system component
MIPDEPGVLLQGEFDPTTPVLDRAPVADFSVEAASDALAVETEASGKSYVSVWKLSLASVWLTGAAFVGLLLAFRSWQFRRTVLAEATPASKRLNETLLRLLEQHNCRRGVRVLQSESQEAPMLLGLLRPTIVFPTSMSRLPAAQEESLLAHEVAHVYRKDQYFALAAIFSCALNFFNPCVWWAHWRLRVASEASVDLWVVEKGRYAAAEYCRALVAVAEAMSKVQPAYMGAGRKPSELRRRVQAIHECASVQSDSHWWFARTLSACLAVGVVSSLISLRPSDPVQAADAPTVVVGRSKATDNIEPMKSSVNVSPQGARVDEAPQSSPELTLRRLVDNEEAWNARISPDGKYLCYRPLGKAGLVVRDLATGKKRVLTPDKHPQHILVSPDSRTIAYCSFPHEERGTFELKLIGMDGSGLRVLRCADHFHPRLKAWSPDGKWILGWGPTGPYDHKTGQFTSEIFRISMTDGSRQTVITLPKRVGVVDTLDVSRDGRYVAYDARLRQVDGSSDQRVFLFDTQKNRDIALGHLDDERLLGWTPDGRNIVFLSNRTGTWDVWFLKVANGAVQGRSQLIYQNIGGIRPLGFAEDGAFYFGRSFTTGSVNTCVVDLEAGRLVSPPKAFHDGVGGCPAWSPDGQYLAHFAASEGNSRRAICIHSLQTGAERVVQLQFSDRLGRGFLRWLCWSPDGGSLLTSHYVGSHAMDPPNRRVYRISAETGEASIYHESDVDTSTAILRIFRAELSTDKRFLVYSASREQIGGDSEWCIFARDLGNGQEEKIYRWNDWPPSFSGCWDLSPDGKRLAVAGDGRNSSAVLKVISLEGDELDQLLPEKWDVPKQVAWAPDGGSVLFSLPRGSGRTELWQVPVVGRKPQKLFTTQTLGSWQPSFCIQPDGKQIAFATARVEYAVWAMENFLPTQ